MREPHSAISLIYNKDISIGEEPTQEVYFMSLAIAQSLLQQYNKNSPYKKRQPIESRADQSSKRFGTWSYANTYDALYEKYSRNKNFNPEMWHQAIKLGEQDQYLAFLEQNKDNTLSDKFYDPQYYDYEAMMMEMYLPFADNTKVENYTQDVYDNATGKWVTEDIGEMTQRQYYEYLLSNTRKIREAEITKDLEQWRKDQLEFWGQFGHSTLATFGELGEGLLTGLAGILDFAVAVGTLGAVPYLAEGAEGDYLDAFVNYFGENGLTAAEKRTVRAALDEYERTHTFFREIDGNITGWGQYFAGIANSIGMMAPAIVANIATGGVAGSFTFYASIFSQNMYENAVDRERANSPAWVKITNAAFKTGVEAIIEWSLGKLLGATMQNRLIGMGGRNIGVDFIEGFGKMSGYRAFVKSGLQEGLEEFLQDFGTNCIDQFTAIWYEGYGNAGVTIQTLIDSFCVGYLSSMVMGGLHIGFSAATSAVQNLKEPGSGDILIETESGPQKVTGFNRLQYSQILSDFREAVDQLKRNKMSATKNIALAQEVYGAVSAISQFYASFDAARIRNCELLLERIVEAQQFEEHYARAASILSPETVAKITKYDRKVKAVIDSAVQKEARTFANDVDIAFRSMVGGVALRHATKIRTATEKVEEELKKADVTEVTAFIDTDGIRHQKDPDIVAVEEKLGKKAMDNIDELRKGYEWIITTDGHAAVETDGYLFVSEAWLQNYTVTDIYKYLEQTRVLQALTTDKTLEPMVKKLIAFDKEFTGQTEVDAERAMMDLLFNKSVYQAFLLSNGGKNVHEFKHFIFQLHEIVKDLANRSKYHQQLFKGKQAQVRINLLNQIYEQIKETMREPTIKAILNWHYDPQTIGADSVLTQRDREVINQFEQRRRVLLNAAKGGKDSSAYMNLIEDIFEDANFGDNVEALIEKCARGEGSIDEMVEARALLDYADARMTTYDFDISPVHSYISVSIERLSQRMKAVDFRQNYDEAAVEMRNIIEDIRRYLVRIVEPEFSLGYLASEKLSAQIDAWFDKTYTNDLINRGTNVDLSLIAMSGNHLLKEYCTEIEKNTVKHLKKIGLGAFTIPYQAAALLSGEKGEAEIQFVADKLDEFEQRYGVSARQMIIGETFGKSASQRKQLAEDMKLLGIDDPTQFAIKKLETMLGGKYIITPTTSTMFEQKNFYDFTIARMVPAEKFISKQVLNVDIGARNKIFEQIFKSENVDTTRHNRWVYNDVLTKALFKKKFESDIDEIQYLLALPESEIDEWLNYLINHAANVDSAGRHILVNPGTGEVFFEGSPWYELLKDILDNLHVNNNSVLLSDIIDVSRLEGVSLNDVPVELVNDSSVDWAGKVFWNRITINTALSDDYFGTLVHEVNHILQRRFNMPGGFNTTLAENMPDFLAYVVNHYPMYIDYALYRGGYTTEHEIPNIGKVTEKDIEKMPQYLKNIVAHCAYTLVQGEFWARAYTHNKTPVHGFMYLQSADDGNYLLSPDGKTRFHIPVVTSSHSESTSHTPPVVAESALDVAIQKLFLLKAHQENRGYMAMAVTRDTYHSHFTRGASADMVQRVVNPALSSIERYSIKLTDVIKNPERYLAPEILKTLKGDYSEGNVFYRIKEYVENNFEGVSIDRKDSLQEEYIWVDDNAFDDLLLPTMIDKAIDDETTIVEQYGGREVPLTKFYSSQELARLGIHPKAFVVIASNVQTETRFDSQHNIGAIFINANENTTDSQIIDKLNHEFRHMLQYYNGFETGFTPNFNVSQEMIDDVKKHVPGLFRNNTVTRWAKTAYGNNWETGLVRHFVYLSVGGELNAYAFNARELYAKPTFVTKEGGNPTIFLPWYDAKTGEGRHTTEFLAMRADDANNEKAIIPRTKKRPKHAAVKVESLDAVDAVRQYVYTTRRDFTKKQAEGTNLIHFVKKGQRNQMDPDLQKFVIATTGHEDKLPPELVNAIKKGILTKQALFKWFREVDDVNDFTFNLLNKYMFKNNYITNMADLDAMLALDPSFYWATAVVLRQEGLGLQSLLNDNDVDKFLSFMKSIEGTKYMKKIEALQTKFDNQWISNGKGGWVKENIGHSDRVQGYMRVLAMQWFDGTLAGAFYVANAFRKTARLYEEEVRGVLSIDAKRGNAKGDTELAIADKITKDDALVGNNATTANDIMAIYEADTDKSIDDMIREMSLAYYEKLCKEADINPSSASKDELMPIAMEVVNYQRSLNDLDFEEITRAYAELLSTQITDTAESFNVDSKRLKKDRRSIVDRIKRRSDAIVKFINEGKIAFTDLPKDIQEMYTYEDATTESGKRGKILVLKPEVYSVGRGRNKLPGATDKVGRLNYMPKHNLTDGNEAFRHDVSGILANEELLTNTLHAIKQTLKNKGGEVKRQRARGEEAARELSRAIKNASTKSKDNMRSTEFKVNTKKKKRTSDTPNVFNVMSGIDMPHVLYKIFDTSFEDLADTQVQFASRDENGQLYDKSQFKPSEFDSRIKHEVSNWDAFYEANRDTLLSLTRNDILDIVEFFQHGMMTMDGPSNKLMAFEIFLLGYIVDGARRNFSNWNLSDAEIEIVEKLYEQKASAHGSGLQAVQQMLKVVDPMKKVRQRMFDDWETVSDEDKDNLIKAVDDVQREKDAKVRAEKAQKVLTMLREFSSRQIAATTKKYPRWSKAWWMALGKRLLREAKPFRYVAMLSGPATWIRNTLSNVLMTGLNHSSDVIATFIFNKKGYRKEQWNLGGTKISAEVKNFIDANILSNPLFNPTKEDIKKGMPNLYNLSSKYDPRENKKAINERGLLVTLIAKAYEKTYAQERRFDSKTMNNVAKFIDNMISDEKFVKFVAGRYFGKMLTIEVERGHVDLSQGLSSEIMDLFAESVIMANQEYMHKRSFGADFLDGIRDKYPKIYEVLTFWQPFLNSSLNWFAESLKYTPMGLANSIVRACRLEKQITALNERRAKGEMVVDSRAAEFFIRRDIGKGILGLILSGFGVMLALSGRIRIDEDDEKFYMYIDENIKLDITNLFGSSSVLVGASFAQLWVKQKDGNVADLEDMLSMVTNTVLDGFFVTDLLDRHKWGGTWDDLLTETESVMRSFVPQIWQTLIACTNSKKIRYSAGIAGMWERWLNTFVPMQPFGNRKINPYTGEVEDKYSLPILGGLLEKGILGPKIYWVEISEYERMCRELGVNKNELTGELTVNGNKYELDRITLNKKYGELNKESLAKIKSQKHKVEMPDGTFKTLSWDDMTDEQRARVISRTMTQNAEIAKVYMWTQVMGKKFYASNSLWQMLRQLGLVKNVYKGDKGFVE